MHHHFERGLWRWWFGENDRWSLELSWGWQGLGFCYRQSTDYERGATGALYFLLGAVHLSRNGEYSPERSIEARVDGEYLWLHNYRGEDEMNSHPFMFQWPWRRWVHVRHERIGPTRSAPYRYELETMGAEPQVVWATYTPEEREWRWMHRLCPVRHVQCYIEVEFSEEVGEGRGSWKGGTVGCSYILLPGEHPLTCLRRMERERRFSR